jgi:predicted DNA binding CopG/RHH family protein
MPKNTITIPKFKTTGEEADWWESREGKRVATEIMRRGIAAGTAKRRRPPLKTVTMRLPEPDIEAAKDLAFRKGIPYQTYIKMLLHEAIEKERHSA